MVSNATSKNYEISKRLIIENGLQSESILRAFVNIKSKPLEGIENPIYNKDVRLTKGTYTLKYSPISELNGKEKERKFVLVADVLDGKISVRLFDWRDFRSHLCKNNAGAQWLLENTNICEELFDIAAHNMGLAIPFAVDFVKYCDKIGQMALRPCALNFIEKAKTEYRRNSK